MYYVYDPTTYIFVTKQEPMFDGDVPLNATLVPVPEEKPQMVAVFDVATETWNYQEWYPAPGQRNIMDDVLTYADIRAMEYPPVTEFLDAYVHDDESRLAAYRATCIAVKQRWPTTMEPITRRAYYQQTLGMLPLPVVAPEPVPEPAPEPAPEPTEG